MPPGAVVLHRRDDRAIPFERGRELAAGLPDATFVAFPGDDHFPWFGDPGPLLEACSGRSGWRRVGGVPRREREAERSDGGAAGATAPSPPRRPLPSPPIPAT